MSFYCPSVKTLVGTHAHFNGRLYIPIRCKRWTCKYCRQLNLKALLDRIRRGKPNKLLTLTCHAQPGIHPGELHRTHRAAIRRVIQKIRREFGECQACTITELTKNGNPHYHLVLRSVYVPQAWLAKQWLKLTGSRIVDIRKIHNPRHAACYVAKYVTKTVGVNKPEWLARVVQFTRHYAPRRKRFLPEDFKWKIEPFAPETLIERENANHSIINDTEYGYWALDPTETAQARDIKWVIAQATQDTT